MGQLSDLERADVTTLNTPDDLLARLNDQRITRFNAQMRVREDAAAEIKRLRKEVEMWDRRWNALKWCHSGCKEERSSWSDPYDCGGSLGN